MLKKKRWKYTGSVFKLPTSKKMRTCTSNIFAYQALQVGRREYSDNWERLAPQCFPEDTSFSKIYVLHLLPDGNVFFNKLLNPSFAHGTTFQKILVTSYFLSLADMQAGLMHDHIYHFVPASWVLGRFLLSGEPHQLASPGPTFCSREYWSSHDGISQPVGL